MKPKTFFISMILFICSIVEIEAKLYTVTQSINVPGMPCQLILVSIYDDMGTADKADDKLLRTDAFLRCGDVMNPYGGNLRIPNESESYIVNISKGSCKGLITSMSTSIDVKYYNELDYLIKIAEAFDKQDKSESQILMYELLDNAPSYFTPYIIKDASEFELEEYLEMIKNE